MIDITGLDKADVLAALYNNSRPQGLGFLQFNPAPMTTEEARAELAAGTYFDYLHGRVMKIDLAADDFFEERLYDRDLGEGAARRVINELRSKISAAA